VVPDLALPHFHIGTALRQQGHSKDAIAEDREVVRLDPGDPHASGRRRRLERGHGGHCKEAIAREPDDAFFHRELAEWLEKKGDLEGAMAQAREAIRMAPDRAGVHFVLAKVLRRKGNKSGAAKEMQIATALQAKSPPRRIRIGSAVMSKRLVYQPRLAYPSEAKNGGSQGTVRLELVIARDGKVQDMKLLSGEPTLAKPAMKSVSNWLFKPSLLSGEPVEVVTEVDVNFQLAAR
jgi:TonB family protein